LDLTTFSNYYGVAAAHSFLDSFLSVINPSIVIRYAAYLLRLL